MKKLLVLLLLLPLAGRSQNQPWSANIVAVTQDGLQQVVTVDYLNGTQKAEDVYRIDQNQSLNSLIQNKLSFLNGPAVSGSITQPLPVTPPPPDLTAQQLAQAIALLNSAQRAVNLGVILPTAPEYQSALSNVKTLYQAKYLGIIYLITEVIWCHSDR